MNTKQLEELKIRLQENLPKELRSSSRWVLWRLEDTPPKNGKAGRPRCKVPKNCTDPARNGSSTGAESWGTFEQALRHVDQIQPEPQYAEDIQSHGVGLTFGAPYFGVDLDKCYDPATRTIDPWASEVLAKLPSTYTELSPSQHGFHLWYRCAEHAKLDDGIRTERAEVYARGRYFTMSGLKFTDCPEVTTLDLKDAKKIFSLIEGFKENKQTQKAAVQQRSEKLQDLMTRVDFPDLSQAVQSLLTLLAIATVCDPQQMEARFKESRIYQETHWKEKWDRLRDSEIQKAIEHGRENLQRRQAQRGRRVEYSKRMKRQRASQFKKIHQKYYWEPWLPIGQLVHFSGGQGQGKTPVLLDLAARMTRGAAWPDETAGSAPKSVLLLNMEDDISAVTIPRFELAGGDLDRLHIVEAMELTPVDDPEAMTLERGLALDKDISELTNNAEEIEDLGLIIIDPITNYLGEAKMNDEAEVRNVLTPLAMMAGKLGVLVATVGHFNRREKGTDPLQRVMGAAAFTGVARGAVMFGPDPEAESTHCHIMTLARGATEHGGLRYHTEVQEMEWDGDRSKVVKVVWDGKAEVHADDATDSTSRENKSRLKEAATLIKDLLSTGRRPANECLALMLQHGFDPKVVSPSRVLRRAGGRARKEGRSWWWQLETTELFEPGTHEF